MLAEELVGITQAKLELPRRVRSLESGAVERVVLMRQNSPIAVIVTVAEYERMRRVEELNEELQDLVAVLEALKADDGERISLDDLKKKHSID